MACYPHGHNLVRREERTESHQAVSLVETEVSGEEGDAMEGTLPKSKWQGHKRITKMVMLTTRKTSTSSPKGSLLWPQSYTATPLSWRGKSRMAGKLHAVHWPSCEPSRPLRVLGLSWDFTHGDWSPWEVSHPSDRLCIRDQSHWARATCARLGQTPLGGCCTWTHVRQRVCHLVCFSSRSCKADQEGTFRHAQLGKMVSVLLLDAPSLSSKWGHQSWCGAESGEETGTRKEQPTSFLQWQRRTPESGYSTVV